MTASSLQSRFRAAYGEQRAAEGRALNRELMRELPYLSVGRLAGQWAVRARTFDAFVTRIVQPMARRLARPLRVLDLGAGNGWLSWRMSLAGHEAVAVDLRDDRVDGLGAAEAYLETDGRFERVMQRCIEHDDVEIAAALRDARHTARAGARIVILDSPFYAREADGERMLEEKRREAMMRFAERAEALMSLPFVEYLTRARLAAASEGLGLAWRRHRVRYPLRYELRPLVARVRGHRTPSRFDLWEAVVA